MFARLGLLATLCAAVGAAPQGTAARSPRNASYTIDARLTPATRTIDATERLTWRNITHRPATSLRFHLYYNAWRDARSTWMRELRLAGGRIDPHPGEWAGTDISTLRVVRDGAPAADLTGRIGFIAPDDGNVDDRTVIDVPLDTPVEPGQTIEVRIAWRAHVPRTFARTGAIGNYFFLGQWFPKIGVLEDGGWNCHQFHATTEFFSDFGVYDVHLTVPSTWIVGATGVELDAHPEGPGETSHHYYQEDVHDFAWTTSPDFVERHARFDEPGLPPVDLRLLLQPEHAGQAERHFAAARAALGSYGRWFGPYPYGHLTIVDPAWQSGTGGMEYPTLYTAGTRWLAPEGSGTPEGVVVHENGHQFWYGLVATNEFEHAWMDEGINTFSTARTLATALPHSFYTERYFGGFIPWVFHDLPLSRIDGDRLAAYRASPRADVPATPSWQYWPGSAGATTYAKTAVWLHTLENYLGWPMLQRILSTYFADWTFRHPGPDDFFFIANQVSGRDLAWYVDEVYRGSQVFDYGVASFRSERQADGRYHTTVVARRYQDGVFPLTVRVGFEDGTEANWTWDGRAQWKRFSADRAARATVASVDPDRVLVLDVNRTNNTASLHPQAPAAARKWSLAWLVWLQDHLLTYGFFV
ncbi:MAG TPA: M1 family metallopeptidase [Vicinamibacterales bacterium]|nr:M1 family metallopeptidase [Vicinamibacterales bacterium]